MPSLAGLFPQIRLECTARARRVTCTGTLWPFYGSVYIYLSVCRSVHIYIYTDIYKYIAHTLLHVPVRVVSAHCDHSIGLFIYIYLYVGLYIYIYIYIQTSIHCVCRSAYIYMYIYRYIYMYIYTDIYICI